MKTLLSSIFLLTAISSSFSQNFRIAPVLGANVTVSNLSKESRTDLEDALNNIYDEKGKVSFLPVVKFQIGGLVEYTLKKSLSIQSGLILNVKGWKFKTDGKYSGIAVSYSTKQTFTYLDLPLWATYRIGTNGFKLIAGPTIGFALKISQTTKESGNGNNEDVTIKGKIGNNADTDDARPIDLALNLGIAKEILVMNKPLELSLNIQPSTTKWNPSSKIDSQRFGRHQVVGVRAAYFFNIK
ncbi:porin family protein [Dyadobacter frigoris]|uniref:PorT family protein n=1 Tax=Dyadobacter frigoris TaxID=2576211 RepID=A0A4U6DA50_9BACT|nr:porin family protein [Dyadobacter frigoris]TKT93167.1 PorT family protein [Dyadobacter frigoris]GLU54796.1 hypothetical protein Dfri01_42570 [Dyadobacter frigoris]